MELHRCGIEICLSRSYLFLLSQTLSQQHKTKSNRLAAASQTCGRNKKNRRRCQADPQTRRAQKSPRSKRGQRNQMRIDRDASLPMQRESVLSESIEPVFEQRAKMGSAERNPLEGADGCQRQHGSPAALPRLAAA